MPTTTELTAYRDEFKAKMAVVEAFMVGFITANAPDAESTNEGYEALRSALDSLDDEPRRLAKLIERQEEDEPGEDMRRDHGTHFLSSGLRAG